MSEDLKDILSHLNPDIDQETLLRYLQDRLTAEEQHEVEKHMIDSEFNSDALEGLQEMKNKKELGGLIEQLNLDLKKKTEKKKRFREKLRLQLDPWLIVAIIIILLLAVTSFILVRRQLKQKNTKTNTKYEVLSTKYESSVESKT